MAVRLFKITFVSPTTEVEGLPQLRADLYGRERGKFGWFGHASDGALPPDLRFNVEAALHMPGMQVGCSRFPLARFGRRGRARFNRGPLFGLSLAREEASTPEAIPPQHQRPPERELELQGCDSFEALACDSLAVERKNLGIWKGP